MLAAAKVPGHAGRRGRRGDARLFRACCKRPCPSWSRNQKHILVIWLAGGVSQLETWDPKPGTDTGGPFRAIPTSVPGMHICELLPHTAKQMHRLAIVRGVNTKEDDHGKGALLHDDRPAAGPGGRLSAPRRGGGQAARAGGQRRCRATSTSRRGGGGGASNDAAFLGPKYASVTLGDGKPPQNTDAARRPERSGRPAAQRVPPAASTTASPAAAARPRPKRTPRRSSRRSS